MTHTGRMHTPIRPGTARRLGIRPPAQWHDTMQRSTRPGWGSTDFPAGWATTSGTAWIVERRGR